MTRIEKPGFCTLCRSNCGTIYTIDNDVLISARPNPLHPTGKAMCPKGRAAPEIAHSARRLRTPLRRTAPKGAADPGFVPISWDEALTEIAEKLGRFRAESGAESVAFAITSRSSSSISDSNDWLQRFVRGFGSPNLVSSTEICNWHKDYAHVFTFGCGMPAPEYRKADLILLWGHNPANVWLAQAEAIGAARARGAKLVVIDPRNAGTARDADLWLRVRPGTDAALALGLAHWLIEHHAYDHDFVKHWTNAAFLVRSDNGHFLRPADLGRSGDGYLVWHVKPGCAVESNDGLNEAALRGRFAIDGPDGPILCRPAFDLYCEALKPFGSGHVETITGIPASQVEALAKEIAAAQSVCYHAWTGVGQHTNATQTERAIATLYALTGAFDAPGGNVVMPALPIPLLHSMDMLPAETRALTLGLDDRPIGPPAHGMITTSDFYEAIVAGNPYRVRGLMAFGTNFLVSYPDPERGREALKHLEFHVHCDLFLNPTADMADVILPVSSAWEYEALKLGFEISPEAQQQIQLRPQMIPRQGDSRSDLWIAFQLAERLGMDELFFDGEIEKGFEYLLKPLGLDLATLRAKPEGVQLTLPHRYRKYRENGFSTQTSKVELYSELLHRHGYAPVPEFVPPAEARSEEFPLTLISVKSGYYCHSQHRGITALRRKREEPTAEIHPNLAASRGISAGDWMRIQTPRGAIQMRAALNDAMAEEVVASDFGWWQAAPDLGLPAATIGLGSNFNSIVSASKHDPISGSIALRSSVCNVSLHEAAGWSGWRRFVVTDRQKHGEDVVAIELRPIDGQALARFRPGQYASVKIDGNIRSYSLTCPAVSQPQAYSIAVRHVSGGLVSPSVHRLKLGSEVDMRSPGGNFALPLHNEFPLVFIAGGIGVTPFVSHLESLSVGDDEPSVTFHYTCRNGVQAPFMQRLEALQERLPNFRLITHFSQPNEGDSFDREGRFNADEIDPNLIRRRARFYICASDKMIADVKASLMSKGVPAFEIFSERFTAPPPPSLEGLTPRQIHFFRSGRTVTWSPGIPLNSILATAERAGVAIPSGCRVGQCESCVVPIKEGVVRHLVDSENLDEGMCLTCQAVPTTDLVLDI